MRPFARWLPLALQRLDATSRQHVLDWVNTAARQPTSQKRRSDGATVALSRSVVTAPPRRQPSRRFTPQPVTRPVRPRRREFTMVVARFVAHWRRRTAGRLDGIRIVLAVMVGVIGCASAIGGALADSYLHRGIETGGEIPVVHHPTGRDLAINADLDRFPVDQMEAVATALQAQGVRYVRQTFAWSTIEPERGAYRWDTTDAMIQILARHRLVPVVVLSRSPSWVRSPGDIGAADAPPVDPADFGRFVEAVVSRYASDLRFVQIWDLPNRLGQWGAGKPDPAAYATVLAWGANAARSAKSTVTVVLGELDVATSDGDFDDLAFLDGVYAAGGATFFDVVAIGLDGGVTSPLDRRVGKSRVNYARAIVFREAMVDRGDAAKPIWATHYGWKKQPYGVVSEGDQAAFAIDGMERARAEWPWLGVLFIWQFLPATPASGETAPEAAYAALGVSGRATPLLEAMQALASESHPPATTGFAPVDSSSFTYGGNWSPQVLDQGEYRTTSEVGARLTLPFVGTGLTARLRLSPGAGAVDVKVDDVPVALDLVAGQARNLDVRLASGLSDANHRLTLRLTGQGELTFGGAIVDRDVPVIWPVVLLLGSGLLLIALAVREAIYIVSERFGHLQRRRASDLWPELPPLPEWRPVRRA